MKRILSIILLFSSPLLFAKKQGVALIDSMTRELEHVSGDTNRARLLITISYNAFLYEPDKGIAYGEEGLQLAKKAKWLYGMANAYESMAANYWAKSDYDKTLQYYQNALDIYTQLRNKVRMARAMSGIGITIGAQRNYKKSLEYELKALKAFRELGDSVYTEGCLDNIGTNYHSLKDYPSALAYFGMALHIAKQTGNKSAQAKISMNTGDIHFTQKEYDAALNYYDEARKCYMAIADDKGYCDVLLKIASLYSIKKRDAYCLQLYEQILPISRRLGDKDNEASIETNMAIIYIKMAKQKQYKANYKIRKKLLGLANIYAGNAEDAAKHIQNPSSLANIYLKLYEVQKMQGNYKAALNTFMKFSSLSDSLNSNEKDKEFTRRELRYEFEKGEDSIKAVNKLASIQLNTLKKEGELLKLKQRQQTLYGIIILSVLLLTGSVFMSRNRVQQLKIKTELAKEKAEKQLKEAEYNTRMKDITFSALRAQMNPHFIFNCLNSIKLYTEQNNTAAASEYLTKFAKLIRSILDNARAEQTTLAAEIDMLHLYLEMEAMRFKEKLKYVINVDKAIDVDFVEIPPLLIQPYVENAIWHGIMPKQNGGLITIDISQMYDEGLLSITVKDNGIGRERAQILKSKTGINQKSYGTKVTAERITLINEQYEAGAQINITDLYDEYGHAAGTQVNIKIPLV